MEIGKPQKTITITPLEEPLGAPREAPVPVTPAPAKDPVLVPA